MLLTYTPPCLVWGSWNIIIRHETVELIISCIMLNISWNFHENPFRCFSVTFLTTLDPEIRKKKLYPRNVFFFIPMWFSISPRADDFMKIHFQIPPKNRKKFCTQKVKHNIQDVSDLCLTYSENFMKIRSSVFPKCCWQTTYELTNWPTGPTFTNMV